ncbi:MAG: hypothetical protein QOJ19_2772, partial [Acidimicrobiia bacterium]|nr:hypothetical protein [Acidimicrobiia bacterium]
MAKLAETHQSKRVGRLATGALTGVLAFGGFAAAAGVAGAAPGPGLQPITDYNNYPPALPDGCPGGSAALQGLEFSNGRGATASDLRQLPVMHDDVVTMTWSNFAPGCSSATVALAAYKADGPTFDMNKDEQLLPGWTGCGPGTDPCQQVNGKYTLSLVVPARGVACNMQLDALLGAPLAVVGPSGSFY